MRYKRLWRDGVINGEKMLVNPHCLGYVHIADLGMITSIENEEDVKKFLETKPYIGELIGPMGHYRFWGKVALRDLNKLQDIIQDLESNCNVKHIDAFIWAEAANVEYPSNLVIKPANRGVSQSIERPAAPVNHSQSQCDFDEVDRKIALILTDHSRTSFKSIATQLKISSKTVIQRYKKLRENLLTFSSITVDLRRLGYKALANVFIKVSNRSKMPEIHSQLLQIPNVIVIIRQMGAYDLYCAIPLEDFEKLFEVKGKIIRIPGVETADIFLTSSPPSWPLNLFCSLLENQYIKPKYWPK
jgi:DNA-binding Lrp family transcriptional regulator